MQATFGGELRESGHLPPGGSGLDSADHIERHCRKGESTVLS
jgi:hypothetical protein